MPLKDVGEACTTSYYERRDSPFVRRAGVLVLTASKAKHASISNSETVNYIFFPRQHGSRLLKHKSLLQRSLSRELGFYSYCWATAVLVCLDGRDISCRKAGEHIRTTENSYLLTSLEEDRSETINIFSLVPNF